MSKRSGRDRSIFGGVIWFKRRADLVWRLLVVAAGPLEGDLDAALRPLNRQLSRECVHAAFGCAVDRNTARKAHVSRDRRDVYYGTFS